MRLGVTPITEQVRECLFCGDDFTPKSAKQLCCSLEHAAEQKKVQRRDTPKKQTEREMMLGWMIGSITGQGGFYDSTLRKHTWDTEQFKTDERWDATLQIVEAAKRHIAEEGPMDLRSLHYLLVSDHLIENTKEEYKALSTKIVTARLRGDIGLDDITDDVREAITYSAWDSPEDFMQHAAPAYKMNLWEPQKELVEVWTEKNTVVRTIEAICSEYRVPLRPLRGQSSLAFIWDAAKYIRSEDKRPLFIYYLGDHDAAGYAIEQSACERLLTLLLDRCGWSMADVIDRLHWERIGFLHEDFEAHDVEALDANEKSESTVHEAFIKRFPDGKAAELEALPPHELRSRVESAIDRHRNEKVWKKALRIEEVGRQQLINRN